MPKHGKNAEPVYDTIDLAATFIETKKIFARMNLSVKDMTALIGAGHSSGKASLTGGEFAGQWVPPQFQIGMNYFRLLTAHGRGWCAVNANGSALFVAGGPKMSQPADEYSPIGYATSCVESVENRSMYGSADAPLPEVDPSKLVQVPGGYHGPAGAAAMLPTDFMLQYSPETYQYVMFWAGNGGGFRHAFTEAWQKATENGVQRLCPEISSTNASVPDYCVNVPAAKANYFTTWGDIKDEVRHNLTQIPDSCQSVASTYCLPSVFRVGWHISGTFDPYPVNGSANYAFGLHGGSEVPFLGVCAEYDGCGGCLSKTIQAIRELGESLQNKYREVIVSVPDILILAATVSYELLSESFWGPIPFRPGRQLYNISDLGVSKADTITACMEIGNRLPGPAYMGRAKVSYTTKEEDIGNMLSNDLVI